MGFKKLDERIRTLIENGIETNHRSMFFIVGEHAQNQVAVIYNILAKAQVRANPAVLWCYKTELAFRGNKKKKVRQIESKKMAGITETSESLFDSFIAGAKIRFAYYKDSKKILGNTFGMLVLQDFEALTPNLLARTLETVCGGGIICVLLPKINELRQLHSLAMDAHARFKTPQAQQVNHRFNSRFLLSLNDNINSLILDDNLLVLPLFSRQLNISPLVKNPTKTDPELTALVDKFYEIPPLGLILPLCKTLSQARVLVKSFELVSRFSTNSVVSITSARGRGKSALLGLIVSAAISIGMSNIYVVAPSPENLVTFFEFVILGLKTLAYDDKNDFYIGYENHEGMKLVTSIRIKKSHRQNVQYLAVGKFESAHNAELIICDEAAAIPLPFVRKLIGPHLLFISSTVNGYEGTGRSLSLKLFNELRVQCLSGKNSTKSFDKNSDKNSSDKIVPTQIWDSNKSFSEFTLQESIRYSDKDPIEFWLNKLLCLDDLNIQKPAKTPLCSTQDCALFYVNRDALFSYHPVAESFLQKLINIFVSSHYKNSPNDLQMLADAPAHHIFVLLPRKVSSAIPEIYCAIQVCFEGGISSQIISDSLDKGKRGAGDLIPWLVSQQFCESNFANLKGVRIVRIATNPSYTSMGYGSCAMEYLVNYFKNGTVLVENKSNHQSEEDFEILEENIQPKSKIPPLLISIDQRSGEKVEYLGVSYGLTAQLLKFWKRNRFVPVYLRQSPNSLTGEYTCVMIKSLENSEDNKHPEWLINYFTDFRSRFLSLLGYSFTNLTPAISLSLIDVRSIKLPSKELTADELYYLLTPHDIKRLEAYSHNMFDLAYVMDLVPIIARLCLDGRIPDIKKNWIQLAVILSLGLQHRSLLSISGDLDIPQNQVVAMFNKIVKKTVSHFNFVLEKNFEVGKDGLGVTEESWKVELAKNPNAQSVSIMKSQKRKKGEMCPVK